MPGTRAGTICAVASPPGRGRRAVLRISGPDTAAVVRETCSDEDGAPIAVEERALLEVRFDDGVGEQPALLLWMPGPGSYTREDVAELHLVGNPALTRAALDRLLALGLRSAQAGEFTRRAFESGRLDLTRAEGVLALVSARSREELSAATALLTGGLGRRVEGLREGLEGVRALTEASLDFVEADSGHVPTVELAGALHAVRRDLLEARGWEERRSPAQGQPRIVLYGAPNAGKSALFNRLSTEGREHRAIESDLPGTTRDAKYGQVALPSGQACLLVDTAGEDPDALGVGRAAQGRQRAELAAAHAVLWVVSCEEASMPLPPGSDAPALLVISKSDLGLGGPGRPARRPAVRVSALDGAGLDELLSALEGLLVQNSGGGSSGVERQLSARHRRALEDGLEQVEQALAQLQAGEPLDLVAETLRAATHALDQVSGRSTPEAVLDRIFARFCLGK